MGVKWPENAPRVLRKLRVSGHVIHCGKMTVRTDRRADGTDWVISPPDEVHPNLGGEGVIGLAAVFAPKTTEIRHMLLRLRRRHRWSQGFAAAVLGASRSTLVKWESGERNPCGPAAKLIFLLYHRLIEKDKVRNCWDLAFWGKFPCRAEGVEELLQGLIELNGTCFVPEEQALQSIESCDPDDAAPQTAIPPRP